MEPREQSDQHFWQLQKQAKDLGVSVVELLLTRSELYWRIKLNDPPRVELLSSGKYP